RGHGPPVVISVLCVPGADPRVGHSDVQEGKQTGVLLERVALSSADVLRDMIPMARWRLGAGAIGPELRDLRLVRRARGAGLCAERLDLVVVGSPLRALEGGRSRGTELRVIHHCEGRAISPLRQQIRRKGGWRGYPLARAAALRRRNRRVGTVPSAPGQDLFRDGFSALDAHVLLRAVGNGPKCRRMEIVEIGGVGGKERNEYCVSRGTGGGCQRSARR